LIIPDLQKGLLYDNVAVPTRFRILVSEKLKGVFDSANVCNIQWYRANIKRGENTLVSSEYYLGNIVSSIDAVDFEKSELDDNCIEFIDKLVLRSDLPHSLPPIFRIKEYKPLKAIFDELKNAIYSSGCTGVKFIEPEKLTL